MSRMSTSQDRERSRGTPVCIASKGNVNRWCTSQRAVLDGRTGELPCGDTSINRFAQYFLNDADSRESTIVVLLQMMGSPVSCLK